MAGLSGNIEALKYAFSKKKIFNLEKKSGIAKMNLLHYACETSNVKIVKFCINN